MRHTHLLLAIALTALPPSARADSLITSFPMTVDGRSITESVSGTTYDVEAALSPYSIDGARGEAMRFDGYSNYVTARLASEATLTEMTFSLWMAIEGYPMMNASEAETTPTYATVAGNLDETAKTGFALMLSSQGDLKLRFFTAGWGPYEITSSEKLPRAEWNHIVALLAADRKLYLYNNGQLLGSRNTMGKIELGVADFMIGRSKDELRSDVFCINTFCGLIDDIQLYDEALDGVVADNTADNPPSFAYPKSRYESDDYARLWRPVFHAMPSGSWTNETHGMAYAGGRYHLFFQKNPNGPYMARLHWGHLSSANLYDWREENIAFGPSESYDIKGCWSGCVYSDPGLTGGTPTAFYTAVNNGKASICTATPQDTDSLALWQKSQRNPIIGACPSGMSADFRDCYVFKANNAYYMIVGTSHDGIAACTLHRYENGSWSNDGSLFFAGESKNTAGSFFEMPNLTPMSDGQYLFTATPLETSVGVETLYWVGTIASDGTFSATTPVAQPGKVELDGFSRDGYGMLSPTVYQHDGRTIALGIVPDKLGQNYNYQIGWAHNYSLPREWSISGGELVQKPYSGLAGMRTSTSYTATDTTITQATDLGSVRGRAVEVEAEFTVGTSTFGLIFLQSGSKGAKLIYNPLQNLLTLDLTQVARIANDGDTFGGVYQASLPTKPQSGETLKMHVFFDHSIFDIFINDRWAASVRVFPTDEEADGVQLYANGSTTVEQVQAWTLDPTLSTGIAIPASTAAPRTARSRAYNLAGQPVGSGYRGIVVSGGRKFVQK